MLRNFHLLATIPLLLAFSLTAATAETNLPDIQENRARALFIELRCVVCQNQSIAGSEADVAKDLREIVREQISIGKSDKDIRDFLVTRYGEFILLKPVFAWHTVVLWAAPVVLLMLGGLLLFFKGRGPVTMAGSGLSKDEEQRIAALLSENDRTAD